MKSDETGIAVHKAKDHDKRCMCRKPYAKYVSKYRRKMRTTNTI
jgi:hypothetical protein